MRFWTRRLLTIPGYYAMFAVSLALAPVAIPLAAGVDLVRRTPLALARSLAFFVWYLGCEAVGLACAFGLWLGGLVLRPSRERWLAWHVALKCWWARQLVRGARWIFDLRFELEDDALCVPGPVLLFMRHASTADTILTSAFLSSRHGIDFRHVIKRELLWDPCLDVAGNRLPNCFVDRFSEDSAREIARVRELARDLGPRDGVLIYPEGTRFTPAKRARILEKLAASGDADLRARAEALEHVLPPRLGGPLALLSARPDADVLFCAHVGLDGIQSFRQFLNGALVHRTIRLVYWRIPAVEIPPDRDAQIDWLFAQWRRVDAWVDSHRKSVE